MLPFQSLNGATAPGNGSVLDLGTVAQQFTAEFVVTDITNGYPGGVEQAASVSGELVGSLDGENWYSLGTFEVSVSMPPAASGVPGLAVFDYNGPHLARYVAVNLTGFNSLGYNGVNYTTTATVSAWIGALLPPC